MTFTFEMSGGMRRERDQYRACPRGGGGSRPEESACTQGQSTVSELLPNMVMGSIPRPFMGGRKSQKSSKESTPHFTWLTGSR